MSTRDYILDVPLPLNQDFKSLKERGLAYIQAYSGFEWTNLNASDPGVTILDQLCFALTELGYCNDFPISDILTGTNGKLQIDNQFYLPEDILTTAPVTINDYRKYIIDGVEGVKNVLIQVHTGHTSKLRRYAPYEVYLLTDQSVNAAGAEKICLAAFFHLNKSRNIGETFFKPKPLQFVPVSVNGTITIENAADKDSILEQAEEAIRNYIFPVISQTGYYQLHKTGVGTNEIFNGPLLHNGFIPTGALGEKKDKLTAVELNQLIGSVAGVKSVSGLSFNQLHSPGVSCSPDQVISVTFDNSLVIICNGKILTTANSQALKSDPGKSPDLDVNIVYGSSANIHPNLPAGNYRDINSYYSIQNTFPEIFSVGAYAIDSNASDFQIAQSRQLKGYLTLFDQVLANQFSQLANTGTLFSFKNTISGNPAGRHEFFAKKDEYERKHLEYPVPYLAFSPTYFYQSLYDVPHIRPLLKDTDAFKFSTAIESDKELENNSWIAYQQDPYNAYIRGLMEFMEEDNTSLLRRNNILDHLLARHGEAPSVINSIIDGSSYTADSLKDQVVFKALYLQNLGLLSYFRFKGYNYLSADILTPPPSHLSINDKQKNFCSNSTDFIFDSEKIERVEHLTENDFLNYSAIELKLNLLFGLKVIYRDYSVQATDNDHLRLALWLIQQRRGLLFIETGLLFAKQAEFELIFKYTTLDQAPQYWELKEMLNHDQKQAIEQFLSLADNEVFSDSFNSGHIIINDVCYQLKQAVDDCFDDIVFKRILDADLFFGFRQVFDNRVDLIFPNFIPALNNDAFKNRLDLFLQNELPVHISGKYHFVGVPVLEKLISKFINWHNSLVFVDVAHLCYDTQTAEAEQLADLLAEINPSGK
jgi:hypothetical protein